MKDLRIVFLGTPDFAVESLKILVENNYNIVGIITAPDKPAGRGQKIMKSAVKVYAEEQSLNILQPTNLKDESFIEELKSLKPDLQIVVAFRMLPEKVWDLPPIGTFNLHASLLPQYRGAAPINWAIINGEKETGVTTFFLEHKIDTGKIIMQESVTIDGNENAGSLHDKLMLKGSRLVLKTVQALSYNSVQLKDQSVLTGDGIELKAAPKIFKEDCKIDWNDHIDIIYNKIRGLSPYPAAWTELKSANKPISCKIFDVSPESSLHDFVPGTLISENATSLMVAVQGGFIHINELQLAGKKRMKTEDFLRGFQNVESFKMK